MSEVNFTPQKTIVYNKHLPYNDLLQDEAADFLAQIKYNIGRAVLLQEINPGLLVWCNHLHKFIRGYGNNFSKEDHITLIKLLYQLLVIPNLEAQFIKSFAYVLHKLIKKRELLTREDLQLPWKPLYELVESVRYSYNVQNGLKRYQDKFIDSLHQVIRFARCYFTDDATVEMLLEWRPLLCPFDDSKRKAGYYFSKFLPTKVNDIEHGYKMWIEEFMYYWLNCTQSANLESLSEDFSRLFMRTAEHNVGYIDWNPYLPEIFNQFLSGLNLPVNGAAFKGNQRYKVICMNNYAKWFVYMIGGESQVFDHLEKLFTVTKSFYHPSNYGKYSIVLLAFLHSLTVHFVKRLHNERFAKYSWINEVQQSHKVTDLEIEKFILIVKDVTLFSMYSKSGSYQAASAIQNLALLRPDLILPELLDKTYEALETLVEPHQVTATLSCITSVARVLVTGGDHLPDAPTHVLRLLYLVLPGIDANDFRKSMSSFTLISSLIGLIPLVDCTPALNSGMEMTEVERELCHASAQFEDFVLQFVDRCFVLIEMSTAEEIAEQDNLMIENMSAQENMLGMGMLSTVQTVMMQSSPKLFQGILNSLHRFISTRVLEVTISGKMVSDLCRAASKTNAKVTLNQFVPMMCSSVKNLASIPGVQDEEHSDSKLLWYLELLSELVRCDGKELLPYKDILIEVITLCLHLKCKKAYSRAGKLLKAILSSCSSLYVTEWCSIKEGFSTPPEEHFYIRDWGKPGDVDDLDVKWHVPSDEELQFVNELLQLFLLPELRKLKDYMSGVSFTRDELHQRLQIIGVTIVGTSCVLPDWENEPVAGLEPFSLVSRDQFSHITGMKKKGTWQPCITRKELAIATHELFEYMLHNNENDTKAFRIISKIYDFLILHNGLNCREYNMRWKTAVAVKKVLSDQLHGNKKHLRAILIERVQLQHDMRLISKRLPRYTIIDEMVVNDLLILSTSDYTEVRVDAQKVLFGCFEALDFSVRSVLPTLLENLKPESMSSHEKLKGTLYVLLYSRVLHLISQYWEFMEMIWPALVCLDQSEKPSIITLIGRLVSRVQSKYETLSLHRSVSEDCQSIAQQLLQSQSPIPHGSHSDINEGDNNPMPSEEMLKSGSEMLQKHNGDHQAFYTSLEDKLVALVGDPVLHWRCVEIGLKLIVILVNHEVKPPMKVANILVESLVHDSLKVRQISIKGLSQLLIQHKRILPRRKIDLANYGVEPTRECLLKLPVGNSRPDGAWLQFHMENKQTCQEDLNKQVFVDKMFIGYYTYPCVVETYESHAVLAKHCCDIGGLSDVEQVIFDMFCNTDFRDKFFKYMSLENKKEDDVFSQDNFILFKCLFKQFQSELLKTMEGNISDLLLENIESKERCCSEVLSGCISGSKNWNYEQLSYMWNFVGSLIKSVYSKSIMPEILRDWGQGLSLATGNRDPNRFHHLYDLLLGNPLSGEGGSLGDSSRLYILQSAIHQQEWRGAEIYRKVYDYLMPHISHQFKNVRDRIGFLLSNLLVPDLACNLYEPTLSPRLKDFVDYVMDDLELSCKEVLEMDLQKNIVAEPSPVTQSENMDCDSLKNGLLSCEEDDDKKRRDRVIKTVLSFLVSRSCVMQPFSKDVFRLVQVLIPLEAREDDPEIVNFCKATFPRLSSKHIPLHIIDFALTSIISTCNCNSWNARRTGLNFLKNMVYHNMFTLNNDVARNQIIDIVLKRLQDEQLEIREIASSLLSGLIHFDYIPVSKNLLDGFLSNTHQKVFKIRYGTQLTPQQQQQNVVSLRLRHAGILGLSACVLAFPHVVTLWMPEILLEIGEHLHGSPQVQEAVKKTLSEFRRTHHDSWHMHRQKFTDDQLTILTDLLVSPSYYA